MQDDVFTVAQSMLPTWWVYGFAFVFGSLWGSFMNVAIYRWPQDMSVVRPASHCPHCNTPIPAYRNVPILAYVFQRGRTACCNVAYSPRYAVVEFLAGMLSVAIAHKFVVSAPDAPLIVALLRWSLYFAFVGGLLVATFADLETMIIPDEVSLLGLAVGAATAAIRGADVGDILFGIGAAFLVTQVFAVWGWTLLTGRPGWGEGDPKFLMFIASFLGWQGAAFAVVLGSMQGIVLYAVAVLSKFKFPDFDALWGDDDEPPVTFASVAAVPADWHPPPTPHGSVPMPFGPCLALAALEFLFFGEAFTNWFSSLFVV